ncbi:MAG: hypothetical protein WCH98_11735 [Verrucomicrobiota bacterium]
MKRLLPLFCCLSLVFLLAGCLFRPMENSGATGSTTIRNTTPEAIRRAAIPVFARHGYTEGRSRFPRSLAFERPAGKLGEFLFGSFGQTTTFRVVLQLVPLSESRDFRIVPTISRVNRAGVVGFETDTRMLGMWSNQLRPILREIDERASGAALRNQPTH